MKDYRNLIVICNQCGEPMRDLGEWPVQWPRADKLKNMQQSFRYTCATCKYTVPNSEFKGCVGISILIEGDVSGDIYRK